MTEVRRKPAIYVALFIVTRAGEHGGVQTVATVRANVEDSELRNEGPFLKTLKRAVTKWIDTTGVGREAWENSSEDFNVGDLATWVGEAELSAALKKEGIHDLVIVVTDVCEGACREWGFDTKLKEDKK